MRKTSWLTVLALCALSGAQMGCSGPQTQEEGWPQWRGAGGRGIAAESGPVEWDPEGLAGGWVRDLEGAGISSPILSGSQLFVTAEEKQGSETLLKVISVDFESGEVLWSTPVYTRPRETFPDRSVINSPAGSTPVTDGQHVFAWFGSHLVALDFDGQVVWFEEIDPTYMDTYWYGAGSSLVIAENNIIVFRDRENLEPGRIGWLAGFDKTTGKQVWRKQWTNSCCSYTTPLVYEAESGTELLVFHSGRLASYDAATGDRLWHKAHPISQPVTSPTRNDDIVCVANRVDNPENILCFRLLTTKKGKTRAKKLWASTRWAPEISSPVIYDGQYYLLHANGTMKSLDVETGQVLWTGRLGPTSHRASLVAGDGKIYAVSQWGDVSVVAAGPTFQLLAQNKLPMGGIIASPLLARGSLVFRTRKGLIRVGGGSI